MGRIAVKGLRRNQYIGDLNGTYLILQTNCDLELINKNNVIWSLPLPLRRQMCALKAQRDGQITISSIFFAGEQAVEMESWKQNIIMGPNDYNELQVLSSQITFEDDQLMVIQTLNNGSELIFYTGPGRDTGLKLKKEPRQIAKNNITVSRDGLKEFSIEIMDYIGDLNHLHLILEQNCSLILANGNQKLWEYQIPDDSIVMNCSIYLDSDGDFYWKTFWYHSPSVEYILDKADSTGFELKLENDQLIITRQRTDRDSDLFHAGLNTRGVLFQRISERSLVINHNDSDRNLPKMGYIGDLNGVYAMFENDCKWVLYNKTQVIWESEVYSGDYWYDCSLVLKRDGAVNLLNGWRQPIWSKINLTNTMDLEKKVMQTELMVNDDGLWLIHTFQDEAVIKYKAKEGTHNFSLVREKEKFMVISDL